MLVSRGDAERAPSPSVLTIGNFDGLHLGHQALLRLLTNKAHALGLPAVVLTFEPHPREYFAPVITSYSIHYTKLYDIEVTDGEHTGG